MAMLTRGVCRAIPRLLAIVRAEVTTPQAMRPGPPSFSLAKTKIASPLAMRLPPYIVFCALNANVFARGSTTAALIANVMLLVSRKRDTVSPPEVGGRGDSQAGCCAGGPLGRRGLLARTGIEAATTARSWPGICQADPAARRGGGAGPTGRIRKTGNAAATF